MQTAQQPECICRSRYRFGWVWDGMASTEPLQARTSCQPRLLRIRANLNPRSAKCLLRTGLAHCYTHAYIKAILKGKLPRRKKATTPSVVLQSVSPSVARAGSRSSVPPQECCVRTGQVLPRQRQRHLHRGLWKHSVCLWQVRPRQNCLQGAHPPVPDPGSDI